MTDSWCTADHTVAEEKQKIIDLNDKTDKLCSK